MKVTAWWKQLTDLSVSHSRSIPVTVRNTTVEENMPSASRTEKATRVAVIMKTSKSRIMSVSTSTLVPTGTLTVTRALNVFSSPQALNFIRVCIISLFLQNHYLSKS